MRVSGRAGDVDAAPDAVDPGGAGVRHHDAGGAQDGQPAEDAEPRVPGALRDLLAVVDRDLDRDVTGAVVRRRDSRDVLADHLPRYRVDRGLADLERQAGLGHRAHARAGAERDPGPGLAVPDGGADQGAVGDVRVVTGVLHHSCLGVVLVELLDREREGRLLPLRQRDPYRVRELAGEQCGVRRGGGRGRARAGGPAVPQSTGHADSMPPWCRRVAHRVVPCGC